MFSDYCAANGCPFLFQYIKYLCTLANEKMRENSRRIERFEREFETIFRKKDTLPEADKHHDDAPETRTKTWIKKRDFRKQKGQKIQVEKGQNDFKQDKTPETGKTDSRFDNNSYNPELDFNFESLSIFDET